MSAEHRDRPTGAPAPEVPIVAEAVRPAATRGDKRSTVLVLLFVVLGPLALGVLWKSPRFSFAWKILLTALTLLQFAVVVYVLWYAVRWFLSTL